MSASAEVVRGLLEALDVPVRNVRRAAALLLLAIGLFAPSVLVEGIQAFGTARVAQIERHIVAPLVDEMTRALEDLPAAALRP